jgi:hypothetical protein
MYLATQNNRTTEARLGSKVETPTASTACLAVGRLYLKKRTRLAERETA